MEGRTNFATWLEGQLADKQITRRGLARTMAKRHPRGESHDTIETYRRALYKYLREGALPSQPMRATIADALGVDATEIPDEDEEADSPLSRDEQRQFFSLMRKVVGP